MTFIRNLRVLWSIHLFFTISLFTLPAYAKYNGGTGEPNDPYQIATAEDLMLLGESPEDYDKHFILTADIDLDPNLPGRKVFDRAVIAPLTSAAQTDLAGAPFTGVLDGNRHTISNLTIEGEEYLGLFGQLKYRGQIKNLSVVNIKVTGSGNCIGGLLGALGYWPMTIGGSITNCHSSGAVTGNDLVGGLVGCSLIGDVAYCSSTVVVMGNDDVGGLVGFIGEYTTVTACNSAGDVIAEGADGVGGLAGTNDGSTSYSCATGNVTGRSVVGGFTGANRGSIRYSYARGDVAGRSEVGGLVGNNAKGNITGSYSTGMISGNENVGGLVGNNAEFLGRIGIVTYSFWDTETSRLPTSDGGTGKATAEMQKPSTFMDVGWHFVGQSDAPHDIWVEPEDGGYPILWWQVAPDYGLPTFSGGVGELSDPYLISTPQDLNSIGYNPRLMKCHFKLVDNVDLTNLHFYPIGGHPLWPYEGVFDGNGLTISNLTIEEEDSYLGLFGALGIGAEIKDLGVVDVNVLSSGNCVGGLVGSGGPGVLTRCYTTGSVQGGSHVGGLAGFGFAENCQSTVTVTGEWCVGGLIGRAFNVSDCYSTGDVYGAYEVGGLVGRNDGPITYCYSTGMVTGNEDVGGLVGFNNEGKIITKSFWDKESSRLESSDGGTGKTTAEMQTARTFLDAGWDFVDEIERGTKDIWWIDAGKGYPKLTWHSIPLWAFSPDPSNSTSDVIHIPTLVWCAGEKATQHDLYFGDNEDAVATATTENFDIYRGLQPAQVTSYEPGVLGLNRTYYWRIDEVNETDPNSPWKGNVWSFTTIDYFLVLSVDDFESYTDDQDSGQAIWQTWINESYNDAYDFNTGSIFNYMKFTEAFVEKSIIHSGRQSMSFCYFNERPNNVFNPIIAYSEAGWTWETPQDWTIGVDTLTLYFQGETGNDSDPFYVAIVDNADRIAVTIHPDAHAVMATDWQKWHISLADLQALGIDLSSVKKISIGVGDREYANRDGGTGRIYIDDIRLTKRML